MNRILWGMTLQDWAWFFGGIVTFVGLVRSLKEFTKTNRIKRAEFLEKLIQEFNDPRMYLAKRVLDDFWVDPHGNAEATDRDLINAGSWEIIEKDDHSHRSITGEGEQRTRQSFDDLLDFFAKLEYYFSLKLISRKELGYFEYYLKRCAYKADGATLTYADQYGYPSLLKLLVALAIQPKNPEHLIKYEAAKVVGR